MSTQPPNVPPPHVRAVLAMVGTLASIEAQSSDPVAKQAAKDALDGARELSAELLPVIDGIRTTMRR